MTFDERVADRSTMMSPAERRVARFFQAHREEVMISSAASLAEKAKTSDATVLRTSKALGFAGLDELRRALAAELRRDLTPTERLTRTLGEIGDDPSAALAATVDIHVKALDRLARDISPDEFGSAVARIAKAKRVLVFGIGPSSALAHYLAMQLARFGLDSGSLGATGLLFADDMRRLRPGDLVIILAYGRVYRELAALLDESHRLGLATILLTDTLAATLRRQVDQVLPVARGRSDMLSMHTATLGLIEALLVGVAAARPRETLESLAALNEARARLAGEPVDLPASEQGG